MIIFKYQNKAKFSPVRFTFVRAQYITAKCDTGAEFVKEIRGKAFERPLQLHILSTKTSREKYGRNFCRKHKMLQAIDERPVGYKESEAKQKDNTCEHDQKTENERY